MAFDWVASEKLLLTAFGGTSIQALHGTMESAIGEYHGHIQPVRAILRKSWTLFTVSSLAVIAHNIKSGEPIWEWNSELVDVAVLGGRRIFVGLMSGEVVCLDIKSGQEKWRSTKTNKHAGRVTCLCYSSHHSVLLSGSSDREVKYWNMDGTVRNKAAVNTADPQNPPKVTCMALVARKAVVVGTADGGLRCFSLEKPGEDYWPKTSHTPLVFVDRSPLPDAGGAAAAGTGIAVADVALPALPEGGAVGEAAGGAAVVAGGGDGSARPSSQQKARVANRAVRVVSVAVFEGKVVAVYANGVMKAFASDNGFGAWTNRVTDAPDGKPTPKPTPRLSYYARKGWFVSGWSDGCARAFSVKDGRMLWTLKELTQRAMTSVFIDRDGLVVMSSAVDRSVFAFDASQLRCDSSGTPLPEPQRSAADRDEEVRRGQSGIARTMATEIEWTVARAEGSRVLTYQFDHSVQAHASRWNVGPIESVWHHVHTPTHITCLAVAQSHTSLLDVIGIGRQTSARHRAPSASVHPVAVDVEAGEGGTGTASGSGSGSGESKSDPSAAQAPLGATPELLVLTGQAFTGLDESNGLSDTDSEDDIESGGGGGGGGGGGNGGGIGGGNAAAGAAAGRGGSSMGAGKGKRRRSLVKRGASTAVRAPSMAGMGGASRVGMGVSGAVDTVAAEAAAARSSMSVRPRVICSDPVTGKKRWEARGHEGWLRGICVSEDAGLVFTCSDDKTVRAWSLHDGSAVWSKVGHGLAVTSLAVDSQRNEVMSGSQDEQVKCWDVLKPDVTDSAPLWTGTGHSDAVTCIAVSVRRGLVLSGSADFTIRCWGVVDAAGVVGATTKARWTSFAHQGVVTCLVVDEMRDLVLSGSTDKTVRTWTLKGGHASATVIHAESPVVGVDVDAQRVYVQTGSYVDVFNKNDVARAVFRLDPDMSPMTCLQLVKDRSHNPQLLFCGGSAGEVLSLDVKRRLAWHGIEVVHNLHKEKGELDRKLAEWMPIIDFWTALAIILLDFLQMVAFAFNGVDPPKEYEGTQAALEGVQFFGRDVNYSMVFFVVCIIIALFVCAFLFQERVEKKFFLNPDSWGWKVGWLVMSLGTKVIATSAFLPIMGLLAEAVDCDFSTGLWSPRKEDGVKCFATDHIPFVLATLAAAVIYVPLCARFFRVGGKLNAIEATWNVWDFSRDDTETRLRLHSLSFKNNQYLVAQIGVKLMLTTTSVFLGESERYFELVAVLKILAGVLMCWIGWRLKPFFDEGANRLRTTLDVGLLWTYVCGFIAVLLRSDEGLTDAQITSRDTLLTGLPVLTFPVLIVGGASQTLWRLYRDRQERKQGRRAVAQRV